MTSAPLTANGVASHCRAFWLEDLGYDWQALTRGRTQRRLAKEAVLFHQGGTASMLYVVVQGRVRLVTYSAAGRERHLAVIGPNGLVGDCGMVDPGRHLTSAVISADAMVYEVPVPEALKAMQAEGVILRQVLAFSDQRFQVMMHHHDLLSAGAAIKRVSFALLGLVHVYGVPDARGRRIRIGFTQEEMASLCSISRVSVSTAFGELAGRGLVLRDARRVIVRDVAALEALAQDSA
jgi:CRP/FNR family transcriptional regulator